MELFMLNWGWSCGLFWFGGTDGGGNSRRTLWTGSRVELGFVCVDGMGRRVFVVEKLSMKYYS